MIKLEKLKQVKYFEGLKDEDLVNIAAKTTERHLGKNENIVIEGIDCRGLYIVSSGRIKVFMTSIEGREHILYFARKGDVFCDICLFKNNCSPVSASTTVPSTVYFLNGKDFKNLMKKIPSLSLKLLEHFSNRMSQLVQMVEDLSFKNVPQRLAKILIDFVNEEGVKHGSNIILKRSITLYEMASMVGTVREVVTRSLQKMEKEGMIKVSRHNIEIIHIEKLKELAGTY